MVVERCPWVLVVDSLPSDQQCIKPKGHRWRHATKYGKDGTWRRKP